MRYRNLFLPVLVPLLFGLASASCRRHGEAPAATDRTPAGGSDEVVARVGGKPITLAELDRKAAPGLERLRYEEYEVRRQALERLISERILETEAASRGLSMDAYLKAEVADRVPAPTPKEIADIYEANKKRFGGRTLEEISADLTRSVKERWQSEQEAVFRQALRSQAQVTILLKEPRADLKVPADAPTLGPADAPVTLVEFLDYQCPYCQRVQPTVNELLTHYGTKLRFVHRDFLLGHPRALPAARAARCAGDQKRFWEYHTRLLTEPSDFSDEDLRKRATSLGLDGAAFATCLGSDRFDPIIKRSVDQGTELGVSGTPTFFINGKRLVGVRPVEDFRQVIDAELGRKS